MCNELRNPGDLTKEVKAKIGDQFIIEDDKDL